MSTTIGPDTGDHAPLDFTMKARHRVVAGLSWDPRADKAGFLDKLKGHNQQYDLDLICFVYDDQGTYIDYVGAEAQDSMARSGKIYHSGDDMTGEGDGDDEFISLEFAEMPSNVAQIVFVVEIRSNHTFEDLEAPEVRVADGMDNRNLFHTFLDEPESKAAKACVSFKLYRDITAETGWSLENIGAYPDISQIEDWAGYLTRYL